MCLKFPKQKAKKKRKKHMKSIIHKTEGTCYLCMLLHETAIIIRHCMSIISLAAGTGQSPSNTA